ncbi:alpha-L-fucosidase [Marinilabilia salmonicolor]|jgi:alpha-L-fucosidase|uniref:alpha-L-fucosidase n=1 Tax=Marinilabilia salmonicolor TaxID=989 RepID=UPI000D04F524|nr:alpha-L-fucosidase [Marinilabilia salmonicolor]PRZ01642.1 alpha-L-fucosidase [Marinilabilia salmonicolor]
MTFKKYFIFILIAGFAFLNASAQEKYIKRVDFEEGETLQSKIHKAARVVPTQQQLNWQKLEMTAFIHFGINTFTGREWGDGSESPEIFNPSELDARQWVKSLKEGGMKMVILTAKHHDGFCLWPTKTTDHSVASSPWKNGNGDIVKELKDACDEFGMKFGVYLSPWDRNAECYGDSPAYNQFFLDQLTELLTWYGKVDEVWFDGANGEGPNGKKQIYDWSAYYKKIEELQPEAVVAIMGEDVRWVGTETGYGRETEWSVTALAPGGTAEMKAINQELDLNAQSKDLGSRELIKKAEHLFWFPAEVDVSIRPGWFYHEEEDSRVKSLAKMVDIYYNSVGMNAVLLLNVPPDKRGLIHENDVAVLKKLKTYIDKTFENNLMQGATFAPELQTQTIPADNLYGAAWKTPRIPASAEASLQGTKTFNVVLLQEDITKGQRVEEFSVEAWINNGWKTIATSTTIGYKKLLRVPETTTNKVRLTIHKSRDKAIISNFGIFQAPEILSDPVILRNKKGEVVITTETAHPVIRYTLDGSEPTASSMEYTGPFILESGGTVKARAFINNFEEQSSIVTRVFYINKSKWAVTDYSTQHEGYPATNAIDGNESTMWHTPWGENVDKHPHHITVDMGEKLKINGFYYSPRAGENKSGTIARYSFFISKNGKKWTKIKDNAEFSNIANNPIRQEVTFNKTCKARFFKLVSHEGAYNEAWISVGEIGVMNVK